MAVASVISSVMFDKAKNVLANIKPGILETIPIDKIEFDANNPGWNPQKSERSKKQQQKIGEAFNYFNDQVINAVVVCIHPDPLKASQGWYKAIDGHGRIDTAKYRGIETIEARVFEPLTEIQIIVFREVLNNGQERFDASVQLADVVLAAKVMNLDIRDAEEADELLGYFPAAMQKSGREKLRVLREWPPKIVEQVSTDAIKLGNGIAYNKIEELTPIARLYVKKHGYGKGVYEELLNLWQQTDVFTGGRAQEVFRKVKTVIGKLPDKHPLTASFIKGEIDASTLEEKSKPVLKKQSKNKKEIDHEAVQQMIIVGLDAIDIDKLQPKQQKGLILKMKDRLADWGELTTSTT